MKLLVNKLFGKFAIFALIIFVTFALWRLGKDEVGFSGWGAAGLIILSVLTEGGIGLISRSVSKLLI